MISTRLDNSNNNHPCTIEKKEMGEGLKENGLEGEGLEGEELDGLEWEGDHIQHINNAEEKN